MSAVLRVSTRNHIVATWNCVLIVVYRVETTVAGVRATNEVYEDLTRTHPRGVFALTIVEKDALMPAVIARDALAEFLANAAGQMILSAVVYEGSGFRAVAVRSVVNGLAMLTNYPYPHRVFARVDGAVGWFSTSSPHARAWDKGELLEAVADVRRRAI
jgi:hypothetical protein